MKLSVLLFIIATPFVLSAQKQTPLAFTILQLNDIYEIGGIEKGTVGGIARVATILKRLKKEDPNTITMLAGDFLSPSLVGTLSYKDTIDCEVQPVAGRQMIEVLNRLGLNYATFGNHEFDIDFKLLGKRINESNFTWIIANAWKPNKEPFVKFKNGLADTIRPYTIRKIKDRNGKVLRIGIIGATITHDYSERGLVFAKLDSAVSVAYKQLKNQCEVIIALTHVDMKDDIQLAKMVPGLNLILGGHDHVNMDTLVGNVPIYKADANARSVYIHRIRFTPGSKKVEIKSELISISDTIRPDAEIQAIVDKWEKFTDASLKKMDYRPADTILYTRDTLDATEKSVRESSTLFTKLVGDAIFNCDSTADFALYNSGSLRGDEKLNGYITELDILRNLPYGGSIAIMHLPGSIIQKILAISHTNNVGQGGYLQLTNANVDSTRDKQNPWYIRGEPLDTNKIYKILMPVYVAQGKEKNLDFLKDYGFCTPNKFKKNALRNDIRDIVIWHMKHLARSKP